MTTIMIVQKDVTSQEFERFFSLAKTNSCDFLVFPEYANGDFGYNHDERVTQQFKKQLCKLAKAYQVHVVCAFIEKQRGKLYNCGYIINDKGEVLGQQKKLSLLPGNETYLLEAGKNLTVFETRHATVGILVCRDFFYPEFSSVLCEMGAKIIFCPMYYVHWSSEYESFVPKTLYPITDAFTALTIIPQARAIENEAFFTTANAAGTITEHNIKDNLAGHSIIAAPLHGKLQQLSHYDEGYMIQTLDLNILEDSKETFAIKKDACPRVDSTTHEQ